MNRKLSFQQFKAFIFVQSLFALFLTAPKLAFAIDIKDTNYPIPSDAYFVSPDGKDTNSGTNPASPWPVAKAVTAAPSGSTIVFRGGTYRNINAKITKKLTLQPYPHEKAWIKGSNIVTDWVADGGIWRKDGWTPSFASNVDDIYIDPSYPMAGYRDMVYINGVSLKQVASKAQVKNGTFYVDAAHKRLYIGSNPTGKMVEATVLDEAFAMWKTKSFNPSDTIIRGLGFAHYADQALSVAAPSVTLENNTIVWNGVQGVRFWGNSGGIVGVSSDEIVRGNNFSYNGRKGITGGEVHRILLEGNTITYNNVEHFSKMWDGAGVKFTNSDHLIWRNNIVENNYATGMWIDISSTNATIVNNTVRNNEAAGIFFELSYKAIIAGNLSVENRGEGIIISDSSSVRVYNNTMSMNAKNLVVKDSKRKNTNAAEIAQGITWSTRNNVVKNNILSNARGKTLFDVSNCDLNDQSALMVTASDHNAYYRTSSSKPAAAIIWSLGKPKCFVKYPDLATFKSETGYEGNSLVFDSVPTNPFFVNPAAGDYRLKPNSPANGHGEALPPDIANAIGVPPGTGVDLGALQSKVLLIQ